MTGPLQTRSATTIDPPIPPIPPTPPAVAASPTTPVGGRAGSRATRRPARRRVLFAILATLPLLAGLLGTPAATADDLSDAVNRQKALESQIAHQKAQVLQLTAQQSTVRANITKALHTLNGINANLSDVQDQITTLSAQIALTRASYQDLSNQLKAINGQLKALSNEEFRRGRALVQRKALLASRIVAAYETGNTSILETVLSSSSFTDALSEVGYYLDVSAQDVALAQQIGQDVRDLAGLHQIVLVTQNDTIELQGLVADQKKELDSQFAELSVAKVKLQGLQHQAAAQIAAERGSYNQLASNKSRLANAIRTATAAKAALIKKIDKLKAEAAQKAVGRIPSVYNGTLVWPMVGNVTQEFGCTGVVFEPPLGSCAHFHQGIDIVAPYGSPVHAAGPGTVLYVGWNYADGYNPAWIVIIAHSAGLETWYAHMQPLAPVPAGQSVVAGQVIGYEGDTGHTTGAHLHWAVRFNGAFVNPRLFL
jgi:murein DD-endopeptidase MepM/ murein hydrolase activator NlpD